MTLQEAFSAYLSAQVAHQKSLADKATAEAAVPPAQAAVVAAQNAVVAAQQAATAADLAEFQAAKDEIVAWNNVLVTGNAGLPVPILPPTSAANV